MLEQDHIEDLEDLPEATDASWMQKIAKERDERLEDDEENVVLLGVPTWGPATSPDLAFEFRVLPRRTVKKYQDQAQKGRKRDREAHEIEADALFLAKAVTGVRMRHPDTGRLVPIEKNGVPVKIEKRLAEVLDLGEEKGKDSLSIIMHLFGGNEIAVGAMAAKVARWMMNTSAEVEDAILGE